MPGRRLQTVLWWLRRPRLYPEFLRLQAGKLFGARNTGAEERTEALAWCRARAEETGAALERLTGRPPAYEVRERYEAFFRSATERADQSPVEMGGPGNIDLLYWLVERAEASRVLETGVAYGWSSLAILLSLEHREGAGLISTDRPYPRYGDEAFVGCAVPRSLRAKWRVIDRADRQALPRALQMMPEIDLCHYDSDKSYDGRMWASPRLWRALRPGGFFVADDIEDNLAFRDFAARVGVEPLVVSWSGHFVGVLVKPTDNRRESPGSQSGSAR